MKTIFVVDDNDTNLMTAKTALDGKYKTFAVPSAAKMFKLAEKITPDLILLDIDMPEMDGLEAMEILKSDVKLKHIPVAFLTAHNDAETELKGFEMGAIDFINKPFSAPVLIKRVEMHIEMDETIKKTKKQVRSVHNATISVISDLVESRDKVTGGHIERTQSYVSLLLNEMVRKGVYVDEISKWDIDLLLPSAQLHDVGKISISDLILNKPGKLTDEEFAIIQTHSDEGKRIIDLIMSRTEDDGFLYHAQRFAYTHHEKWNGTGYPQKLSGENIPLEGRIMAVADVYDALVSQRPYKKAFTHEEAVTIIKKDSGTHFDPKIVEAFENVADDFWVELMRFSTNA